MSTPYLVTHKPTGSKFLVKNVPSKQSAITLVASPDYSAEVASKDHLTDMLQFGGVTILDPKAPKKEPATQE